MSSGRSRPDTGEAPISASVVERVAERQGVDGQSIADALVELNAVLLGRHSNFERAYEYVTVDGTRAYRVAAGEWGTLTDDFGFDGDLAAAVEHAHTEQARLLFARSVCGHDQFATDESGVVIGIDTAEVF